MARACYSRIQQENIQSPFCLGHKGFDSCRALGEGLRVGKEGGSTGALGHAKAHLRKKQQEGWIKKHEKSSISIKKQDSMSTELYGMHRWWYSKYSTGIWACLPFPSTRTGYHTKLQRCCAVKFWWETLQHVFRTSIGLYGLMDVYKSVSIRSAKLVLSQSILFHSTTLIWYGMAWFRMKAHQINTSLRLVYLQNSAVFSQGEVFTAIWHAWDFCKHSKSAFKSMF